MWQRHETTERNQRIANFVAGARQGVVNMTSLDFNRAKEDVQRVIDSSTGQFRDDFQQRAKDFTTVVEQSKVVTQGTVNAAAVQSIDGNSALVLVAATSRITNAAGAKDEPRNWRLKVTVTDDGGQYKMSKRGVRSMSEDNRSIDAADDFRRNRLPNKPNAVDVASHARGAR